jgi:hypothetical protein
MYDMIEDNRGFIWISSDEDIYRFDPQNKTFLIPNQSMKIDMGYSIVGFCKEDGTLFTASASMFYEINTNSFNGNPNIPKIVFSNFKVMERDTVFEKNLNDLSSIKLPHDKNFITVEFAALNFSHSENNQYAYKLDGIDKDWVMNGNKNFASYSNLAPGNYLFHVKASNNTGLWNDAGKTLLIIISPAWWQTWWFKLTLTVIVTAIIILLIRLYIIRKVYKQKAELKRQLDIIAERERITADLHDDVGATLSSIYIYGDLANTVWDEQPGQSKEMVSKMSSQSKELMAKMSDIVWSLKSPEEEKNSFLLKLKNYSQDLLAGKGIAAHFAIDETLDLKMTNPLVRKNLLLIAKEAINNIAKYSGATEAFITLSQQEGEAELTIRDNGKGFDKTLLVHGNGLGNIEQRCRQLNGTCMIESGPGNGVTITCRFPIAIISHRT